MRQVQEILQGARSGQRLSKDETLALLRSKDLLSIGRTAAELSARENRDRAGIVTYIVDRNINYTNVCVSGCKFCAFYREKDEDGAYLLSREEIYKKVQETLDLGGVQILMQGGLHPDLKIDYFTGLFEGIKEKFPTIHIHALSPPEIIHISSISGLKISETISILKEAGLDSIPGGGAEVLSDVVRERISPGKCSAGQWMETMETAHKLGLRSSATMMFGHLERDEDIADHLVRLRELQDRTKGFTAFIPWTFQWKNTSLGRSRPVGGFGYLRMVAVSRIVLDNIRNIQASWVTQGPKVAQMSLLFGANDMGSTMIEENVVRAAGASFRMTSEAICRLILDLGLRPVRRQNDYSLIK